MQFANFTKDTDELTRQQMQECTNQPFVTAAALMPDAHAGYVAPVGAVLVTENMIVPSWIGYDIGCGVATAKLSCTKQDVEQQKQIIYNNVKQVVPVGKGELHKQSKNSEQLTQCIEQLKLQPHNANLLNMVRMNAPRNLGTLGAGNHFIELGIYKEEVYITIHSGSRNIGHKIATHYMKQAAQGAQEPEAIYPIDINSEVGKEYIAAMNFCLEFAKLNRVEMISKVTEVISQVLHQEVQRETLVNNNHNHAIIQGTEVIHRKGATPAAKGELGAIPANMRDGVYVVEGLGSDNFLQSASHGAGRVMSRSQARQQVSMQAYQEATKHIVGTVNEKTLDEAPQVYKDIHEVMELQQESVKVLKHILPLINWKG